MAPAARPAAPRVGQHGPLIRPPAAARRDEDPEAQAAAEHAALAALVGVQRDIGVPFPCDGGPEPADFVAGLAGFEGGALIDAPALPDDHPVFAAARRLAGAARGNCMARLPHPAALAAVDLSRAPQALREPEAALEAAAALWGQAIAGLAKAGVTLIQMDAAPAEGDPGRARLQAQALAAALRGRPDAALIGAVLPAMTPDAAEIWFDAGADVWLIPADGAAMLAALPPGARALLGAIPADAPPALDDLRRLIDAAPADPAQLGLAPAVGFHAPPAASPADIRRAADAQWRRLELCVTAALAIWGDVTG
jgi:hypothetical protein